jgi:hypothetical protein
MNLTTYWIIVPFWIITLPALDCIAQVTPNQQLDQAILDQGLREMEQLL